ncbi:MLP-like protein 423 [Linum perenne]
MSDSMEVSLFSSANDVWGAITTATAVYPKAMRNLYQQISVLTGDGYTVGSIRTITFGPAFSRVVQRATEKIEDIDHDNLTIQSSFSDDGGFIPTLFNSFDMKIIVVRSSRDIKAPGCTVKWEFDYRGSHGNADITNFKNVTRDAFKDLDAYLRRSRPIVRRWFHFLRS